MNEIFKPGKGSQLQNMLKNLSAPTSTDIIPYLNRYMEEHPYTGSYTVDDVEKHPDHYFHPSGDCDKCKRLLFFEKSPRFTVINEVSPDLRRVFKVGHAVHAMVQAWIADMGKHPGFPRSAHGPEVSMKSDELNIKGSIDDILLFPNVEQEIPLEIKTCNSSKFATLKEPMSKHILQVRIYLFLRGLPEGIILYIEKDYPHAMKEFRVQAGSVEHILLRWRRVLEALAADDISILEYECRAGSKEEARCPARAYCKQIKR